MPGIVVFELGYFQEKNCPLGAHLRQGIGTNAQLSSYLNERLERIKLFDSNSGATNYIYKQAYFAPKIPMSGYQMRQL